LDSGFLEKENEMNKSESIKMLAGALSLTQAEMPAVKFNATNPFLKNKYADLGAVIDTSKKILAKHGLSVSQLVESQENKIGVTTILMHNSGEWLESTCWLELGDERGKSNAQVAGSIVTYLRRYSLASILGMYADEDDDGNKPDNQKIQPKPQPVKQPNHPEKQDSSLVEAAQELGGVVKATMTLETAENMKDSKGKRYGDMTNDDLSGYSIGIGKLLAKNGLTPEKHDEYQMKLDAIKVILESRNK
jgi:hypothetical protein